MNPETQKLIEETVNRQTQALQTEYSAKFAEASQAIQTLRTENYILKEANERLRRNAVQGQGSRQGTPPGPTKELLQSVLVPKVEMTSLEDICAVESERRGGDRFYRLRD